MSHPASAKPQTQNQGSGVRPVSAKPPKFPAGSHGLSDGNVVSYEDLIVAQYLDEIKTQPPYAKPGANKEPSPYIQRLKHTNIVPTPGMVQAAKHSGNRPVSASAIGRSRSTGKPKIDAKFIADPSLWDPATPRDEQKSPKKRRPISAPAAKYRPLSANYGSPARRSRPLYRKIPKTIVATAFKNGNRDVFARVAAPNLKQLLEICTEKLGLTSAARRVFLEDGSEAWQPDHIPRDAEIYISMGEEFKDPYKTVKASTKLKLSSQWTMNGVVFQQEQRKRKNKCQLSKRFRKANFGGGKTRRVLVFRNGKGVEPIEVLCNLDNYEDFLIVCTAKLDLRSHARIAYDWEGTEVFDLHETPALDDCLQTWTTPVLGPVWMSTGEGFSPSGVQTFLRDVIKQCRTKVKQADHYKRQLELAKGDEESKSGITITAILSMSDSEVDETLKIVEKEIEDHTNAINRLKSQLQKISDEANEEEAEGHQYKMKHIKKFETNDRLVGESGLRLRVFDNGTCDQEHVMYFSLRDFAKGAAGNKELMMARLLDQMSMRRSGSQGPVGRRLFDKFGNEITDVRNLKYDQEVWLSYGENYKSPYSYVLQVIFDKATGVNVYGEKQTAFREQLMKEDVEGPEFSKSSSWEGSIGLPMTYENRELDQNTHPVEREHMMNLLGVCEVSASSHFLQNKDNPQLLLYPELVIDVKKKKGLQDQWPGEAQIWVISKSGYIYSKGMSALVLAVSDQEVKTSLKTSKGTEVEGFVVNLQKKMIGNPNQRWGFTNDGFIYSLGQPELVLTHLGPLFGDEENQIAYGPAGQRAYLAVCERVQGKDIHQQRWAIKQERLDNIGQWKHTQGVDQEWKKRAYSWPVTEEGNWNDDFDWPMEGFLIPGVPPMKKNQKDNQSGHIPLRLMVLKNGEKETRMITPVVGPNLTNMMKDLNKTAQNGKKHMGHSHKHNHHHGSQEDNDDSVANELHLHCEEMTLQQLEMLLFLERCTSLLDLPFAARRLFDQDGREHATLTELKRDQLVYVSCGEVWNDPNLSKKEQQRRFLLANLAADVAQIRQFVGLRDPEEYVLEIEGAAIPNAKLTVNKCCVPMENQENGDVTGDEENDENEEQVEPTEEQTSLDSIVEHNTAHERSHMNSDNHLEKLKWPWERIANEELTEAFDNPPVSPKATERERQQARSRSRSPTKSPRQPGLHLQKFSFQDGYLQSVSNPNVVLGIAEQEGRVIEVVLVKKRPDDIHQRWVIHENGVIQAKHNRQMVLSVSMPTNLRKDNDSIPLSYVGCGVTLQQIKTTQFGRSNQRWRVDENSGFIHAFHTDYVDKEITAANKANVCTYAVNQEPLDQPGYTAYIPISNNKFKQIFLCTSCARAMRGRQKLEKIPYSVDFVCAMGTAKENGVKQVGSFQCLNGKVDLSTYEAENTLREWEEQLDRLRQETSVRAIAREISAAKTVQTVKIYAYRNGEGRLKPGELIVGSSVIGLLEQCTYRLQMTCAARRLYTSDGLIILDIDDLINWAVVNYMNAMKQKRKQKLRTEPEGQSQENKKEEDESSQNGSQKTESSRPTDVNQLIQKETMNDSTSEKEGSQKAMQERVSLHDRRNSIDKMEPPPLEVVLRYPVEIWASAGEIFVKPEDVEERYLEQLQQREERTAVTYELEKEKHVLRQMQGRRMDEMNPGEYRSTRSPVHPVVIENSWQEPTVDEQEKHDKVHQLETHLSEVKTSQRDTSPTRQCNTNTTRRLYQQPSMKRVLLFPNGASVDRACYVWGESLEQLLDNATTRLNLRKVGKILYTVDGYQIKEFSEVEKDQLLCVSFGRPFLNPKENQQSVEVKANWSRTRKQHGQKATDIKVQPQRNLHIDVDPFGPPILALTDGSEYTAGKPPAATDYHQSR